MPVVRWPPPSAAWTSNRPPRALLIVLLCAVLAIGAAGCWSSSDPAPEPGEPAEAPAPVHVGAAVHTDRVRDLGRAEMKDPDPEDMVSVAEGILAPANHVWITLDRGRGRQDAEAISDG